MDIMIFDMDGTLLNAFPLHIKAFIQMLKELFNVDVGKENIIKHFGAPIDGCIKRIIEGNTTKKNVSDFTIDNAILVYKEKLNNSLKDKKSLKVLPGVKSLLNSLKEDGHTLVLMTGCTKMVGERIIGLSGLKKFFSEEFYGDGFNKREQLLENTISVLKGKYSDINKIVVFGDAVADIEASKFCRAITISVATGLTPYEKLLSCKPDLLFKNFSDYRNVKEKIDWIIQKP